MLVGEMFLLFAMDGSLCFLVSLFLPSSCHGNVININTVQINYYKFVMLRFN